MPGKAARKHSMQEYTEFAKEIKAFRDEVRSWPNDKKQSLLEQFDEMMRYIGSDEFAKIQTEQYIREQEQLERNILSMQLIEKAKEQGIITEREYLSLLNKILMLGELVVSPEMAAKLSQVEINPAEESNLPDGFMLLHTCDGQWYCWNTTGILYVRFAGPYMDEMTACLWCVEQHEILEAFKNAPQRGKVSYAR